MSDTNNNGRWVKLHISMLDWEWHDVPEMVSLFVHLITMAQHEDYRWRGMVIKRGQLVTSIRKLVKVTGITMQSVRTCLGKLELTHEITRKSTHRNTLITICNYERYQHNPKESNTLGNTQDNTLLTQHQTRYKEDNIVDVVVARTRERVFSPASVQNGCMSLGIDEVTYLQLAEQVFADWEVGEEPDPTVKHFQATMRIKVDAWRRQQQNQQRETPLERRQRAEREAMMAAAAAINQTINNHTK